MRHRLERLRGQLQEREIAALLVTGAANRRYLSGFSGSAGTLLITQDVALIFSDFRYRLQIGREAPDFELLETSNDLPLQSRIAAAAADLRLRDLAIEADHLTVSGYDRLREALREVFASRSDLAEAPVLRPLVGLIEELREIKDGAELATLRRAIAITDSAITAVLPYLRPEQTERQVAWMLEVAMRERGAEGVSFPIIVAAGPNGAHPHARPGDEALGTGRPIVIDMGARVDSYHADLTRTVILGAPDDRFQRIYDIVLAAQQQAIGGLCAGMSANEADALARDYIAGAGFGDFFGHGLGHGVGLNIHEAPGLRRGSGQTLHAGNVFSVEPGIYLPEWGGVRIEDLVLLHVDHAEVLSRAPKLR